MPNLKEVLVVHTIDEKEVVSLYSTPWKIIRVYFYSKTLNIK